MNFIEKAKGIEVLIVGDVMIDSYLSGKVARISPEAPVPVLEFASKIERLGGAANVALNVKALDAIPVLLSITGNDENAVLLKDLLLQEKLDPDHVVAIPGRQTTIKTRIMSGNQQLLRVDREDTEDITGRQEEIIFEHFEKILDSRTIRVIILQDYNKGLLTAGLIRKIIQSANAHDIPVAVDPKRKNFFEYGNVTLFKPNLKEISEALAWRTEIRTEDLHRVAFGLNARMPHQMTMITLSDKGIFTFDGAHSELSPTQPRDIADVCGAGDSVIAVAALGIATGEQIVEIARIANIAGGQVCEEIGVVPVNKAKLFSEI
jgi:rfaE bifunctional protein kinase chain/domain